jgi:hypothetical protein
VSAADASGNHQESTNISLVTALMAQLNVTAEQITNGLSRPGFDGELVSWFSGVR